jgi:hypothetical protein
MPKSHYSYEYRLQQHKNWTVNADIQNRPILMTESDGTEYLFSTGEVKPPSLYTTVNRALYRQIRERQITYPDRQSRDWQPSMISFDLGQVSTLG